MEADIVISIAVVTGVVLIINQLGRIARSRMLHKTVREALSRDSNLTPELLASIEEQQPARGGGDGRTGLVLLALGWAVLGFGALTGDVEDFRNVAGIALFPLFVGTALLGRAWYLRRYGAES